ncbi:MAG: 5-(carboxyamino)imidazole ribonucleotide synthase, partial [Verrucomicrobia bacterium]|nr:5-(carboxyamino)imidazole ribonucleotide synthase [Verrucomicrobiota bacterium]
DVVTLENEFVDAGLLRQLESEGFSVRPTARSMELVQDKLIQKAALRSAGLAVPAFVDVPTRAALDQAIVELGLPLVLKKRRNGYDGKGNTTLHTAQNAQTAWEFLQGDVNALFAEGFVNFSAELAVMITRALDGSSVIYPVVETIQRHHICHVVKAPAQIPDALAAQVRVLAQHAVETMQGVGSFGVELFYSSTGNVVINELAPRVHNSGHYTIEGCVCSQFENHVRAVLGWPLGSTALRSPAAVMINLLGIERGSGYPQGIDRALQIDGAHLHVYGKNSSMPSRKMGHVTALGGSVEDALQKAQGAAALIRFGGSDNLIL